jgi:trk system potassium uptake protein TrkH
MLPLLSIVHVLGGLLMVFSSTFLLPLAWAVGTNDPSVNAFLASGLISLTLGFSVWASTRRKRKELSPRDGCLLVVLGWVMMASMATVPLIWTIPGLSFTDAFFETISGLTTSGATVLTGLDDLPQAINIWRHALVWFGGMGIILLAVAILPLLGVGGMQLFKAETPGPLKEGKLTPRITQTAKYLWLLYAAITVAAIVALRLAGLDWYESVCHAFSVMGLGGFSTRDASVSHFDSVVVEVVLMVFMMIAVLNFTTHFLALRQRSLGVYFRDPEVFAVWTLILGSCLLVALYLVWTSTYDSFGQALRFASFNVISIASSTGYMSTNYEAWPIFAPMWMLFLSVVSSSAGSTGGGIKMIRALILLRQARHELMRLVHPRAVTPMCLGSSIVDNRVVLAVLGYMLLYGVTLLALTFLLLLTGLDFLTAFSSVIACLNNMGPGLGGTGPTQNYQGLTDLQTWLCSFAMLAGRLELLTLFVIFTPAFWRR